MDSLRNEILRVKNKDRPYTETDIVYDSLVSVIESRRNLVVRAKKLAAAKGTVIDQAVFNHRAKDLETVFQVFSYTDRVDSPRIPFEVLRSLSWVANKLFGEQCYTVVRLEPKYNYGILSCRREFEKNGWGKYWQYADEGQHDSLSIQNGQAPPNVLLLGFPSPDAGSTLVHALAAHEFGHEFAFKWNNDIKDVREAVVTAVKGSYNVDLQDYLWGIITRREGESQDDVTEKARRYIFALIDKITSGWLSEIFSDLVAARLVGPAFLAAFDRIIIGHGKAGETHPSASLRRSLVRRYLKDFLPEVISDPTWAHLFDGTSTAVGSSDELYGVIEKVFDSMIIEALKPILNRIPSPLTRLSPPEFAELLETMEDHIDHLATPSVPLTLGDHLPDTDKFWLLMFAAWHYRLSPRFEKLREICGDDPNSAKAEEVLGNLLLHALLSLELRARWQDKLSKGGANVA
ncbi:MAG: hypothetical protein QOH41_1786 [Blastocatellia bacterium]|jgi:hypothetical protein|nr:hypothetical protein [Blastocatellia bacterium]